MKEKPPAFQFYPKDLLSCSKAMAMPNECLGIYWKLLCHDWINDGIEDDERQWMRLGGYDFTDYQGGQRENEDYEIIVSHLKGVFSKHPNKKGFVTNPRLGKERKKQTEKSMARASAGQAGAKKRWKQNDGNTNGKAIAKDSSSSSSSSSSSNKKNKDLVHPSKKTARAAPPPKKFDRFIQAWCKYPLKVGKKEAERHYKASVKSIEDHNDCLKAIQNYKEFVHAEKASRRNGDSRPWQNGSTFFNNWRDFVDFKVPTNGKPKTKQDLEWEKLCRKHGMDPDNLPHDIDDWPKELHYIEEENHG